jgi:hypothetical protein
MRPSTRWAALESSRAKSGVSLLIGAGTFINPLLKIVTTVAILAAVYFFIVKPTLDTTEQAFETVSPAFQQLDDVPVQVRRSIRQAQRLQENANQVGQVQLEEANRLIACINRADSDVDRITSCNQKFGP